MKLKFEISEHDHKVIETHKCDIQEWDRIERTFSYLRRKYGQPRSSKTLQQPENNWVQE